MWLICGHEKYEQIYIWTGWLLKQGKEGIWGRAQKNLFFFKMHVNENKIKRHINKSLDPKAVVLIICYWKKKNILVTNFPFQMVLLSTCKWKLDFAQSLGIRTVLHIQPEVVSSNLFMKVRCFPLKIQWALNNIITKYQFYKICCLISLLLNIRAFYMET